MKLKETHNITNIRCYLKHLETGMVYDVRLAPAQLQLDETEAEYVAEVMVYGDPRTVRVRVYVDEHLTITRAYFLQRGDITRGELVPRADYADYHNGVLRAALGYTDADLKANQSGKLTEQQRQMLMTHTWRLLAQGVVLGFIVAAIMTLILFGAAGALRQPEAGWVFFGFWVLAFIADGIITFYRAAKAVRSGVVQTYTDRIHSPFPSYLKRRWRMYFVRVGDKDLMHNDPSLFDMFVKGERYHVYALPNYPVILSAVMDDAPSV